MPSDIASRDEVVEIFGVRGVLQTHRGTQPPAEAHVGGSPVPGGHERSDGGKGGRQFGPYGGGKGKGGEGNKFSKKGCGALSPRGGLAAAVLVATLRSWQAKADATEEGCNA